MVQDMTRFDRVERLLGTPTLQCLRDCRVILFGVGGVGSWCAEALVRSGIGHLTIVDNDVVATTNLNRQLMATTSTLGMPKVEALRDRLLTIAPDADVQALCQVYDADTAESFRLETYDYVIDAIDSLRPKASLILHATRVGTRLYSAMGAALKMDPTRIRVAEFWQAKGCPLARALRNQFKKSAQYPSRKFQVVYSDELLPNLGGSNPSDVDAWSNHRAQVNGSLCHEVGIFGFTLASLVIQDLHKSSNVK